MIPAEDFFFSVFPNEEEEGQWELVFHIRTTSEPQARAIFALLSMARSFLENSPEPSQRITVVDFFPVLFANPLNRERSNLMLRSALMDTDELSLLFQAFSIYSTHGVAPVAQTL